MDVAGLLAELYGRIPPLAGRAVAGLDRELLVTSPAEGANTIAWLVWHSARVQDSHIAEIDGRPQLWEGAGWAARFGLDPDPSNTGWGHTAEQMSAVRPDGPEVLLEYLAATQARSCALIGGLADDDLDRIVDRRWDPPVSLGVRLVSVADDCLQHVGQAAYVRGVLDR